MKKIDAAGFEKKFRDNIDPWSYGTSTFEAYKRQILLRACGPGVHGRGLELACAIGETSRFLAGRNMKLLAVDSSTTALGEAKRRNANAVKTTFRHCLLPREMPRGPFDLIVASEIAYYLTIVDLGSLLRGMHAALAPGGRVVILHHLRPFADAAQLPALAQERMQRAFGSRMKKVLDERHARFAIAAYRKHRQ